jgi:hypothetical protein
VQTIELDSGTFQSPKQRIAMCRRRERHLPSAVMGSTVAEIDRAREWIDVMAGVVREPRRTN